MLDAASGQLDRIRDRTWRRVPVRNHRDPVEAEQVGAAVRVGVEAVAQPSRRATDQKTTDAATSTAADLLAQRVHERFDRSFHELERDVSREAVADDDVGGPVQEIAALGVALETEIAPGEQLMGLESQLVSLLGLLADREQAHRGTGDAEDLLREDR